jgi:tRNA synthetases class I (E and Q), catalytic domain
MCCLLAWLIDDLQFARQLIKEGKAYMDDTDQEKMQAERMERVESARRSSAVEDNLAIFEKLLLGTWPLYLNIYVYMSSSVDEVST